MIELKIGLVIFLLILSAFFSGSEAALISLSKLKLKRLKNPILTEILKHPNRLLTGLLSGTTIVNILACVITTTIFLDIFAARGWKKELATLLSIIVMSVVIIIFAEMLPIAYGAAKSEKVAKKVALPVKWFLQIFSPFIKCFILLANCVVNILSHFLPEDKGLTQEEVETMVRAGHKEGAIEEEEKKMISGILRFTDTLVKDVMVPISNVVSVDEKTFIKELLELVRKTGYSRIPVYQKEKGNIVGVIHTKELLGYFGKNGPISSLVRSPHIVLAEKRTNDLLKEFQREKIHLGIVKEKGRVVGIVTMEDLLEEIVGEIEDDR
ncbi:MAG: hemolysin family protein [bacterium]